MPLAAPWSDFDHDPRLPQNASLRAGDRDREVVRQVLAEAYGDGRLDRDELDVRTGALEEPITLGALAALLTDLVPQHDTGYGAQHGARLVARDGSPVPATVQQGAVAEYESARRHALLAFLAPSVICSVIYLATALGSGFYFPWPLIVIAVTGMNLLRTLVGRPDIIAEAIQRPALEQRSEPGTSDA